MKQVVTKVVSKTIAYAITGVIVVESMKLSNFVINKGLDLVNNALEASSANNS